MHRCGIAVLLAILCLATFAQAQEMSEAAAIARFQAVNQTLHALDARVRMTQAEAARAGLRPNPGVTYNREDSAATLDNFLLVQQSVPLNGRLGMMRRAGNAAVEAANADTQYARWSLTCDLRIAFYSLLLAQEREASWEGGVANFEEVVRIVRERENAGEGSTFDRLRAERELADAQAQRAVARAQRVQAQARLSSFFDLGGDFSALRAAGELPFTDALLPVDELVQRALARRGDYRGEVKQAERYELERRAAERGKIPDPLISAGLKRSRFQGRSDSGYAAAVTFSVPLFNRGQADAALARAASDRSSALSRAAEQQIHAEVRGTHEAAEIRMQVAREYGRQLESTSNELARISKTAYEEGEQGILTLLDAYRLALTSRVRVHELQADARMAHIELERAVGDEVTR